MRNVSNRFGFACANIILCGSIRFDCEMGFKKLGQQIYSAKFICHKQFQWSSRKEQTREKYFKMHLFDIMLEDIHRLCAYVAK